MPGPIPPVNNLNSSPIVQAAKGVLPNLKTGSIVLAQVIRTEAPNPQQIKQGLQRIQLRLEGQLIAVSSNKPMQPGSTVKLQVTGPNQWTLMPNLPAAKTVPPNLNAWMQAQRQSLPTQTELGSVIRNLLTQSAGLTNLSQNSALNSMAKILLASNRELLSSLLSKSDLSDPSKILKAIKNSGLTFESKILRKNEPAASRPGGATNPNANSPSSSAAGGDLKSILLKTIQQLETVKATQAKPTATTPATTQTAKTIAGNNTNPVTARTPEGKTTNHTASQTRTPEGKTINHTASQTRTPEGKTINHTAGQTRTPGATSNPASNPTSRPANNPARTPANIPTSSTLINTAIAPKTPKVAAPAQTTPLKQQTAIPNVANTSQKPVAPVNTQQTSRGSAELIELMLNQLNGGLAKIQQQQLQSVGSQNQWSNPANIQNSWLFDLPVLNNPNVDSFNIRIDQEDPQTNPDNSRTENGWVITLRFDLDKLGPISVKARLVGLEVSMDLWSQRPSVLAMMQKEFTNLQQALESKGLDVKSLKSHYGVLKEPRPVVEQSLLHVET